MKRRAFIAGLRGAAAWPLVARAQQPTMPVIGVLASLSPNQNLERLNAFRQSLSASGYVEGQNVRIDYRWAEGDYTRLARLAAELVRKQVAVIATTIPQAAQAAKNATSTIPIVFSTGVDPVASGLVASMNRPGGNATGIYVLTNALEAKRLELLHDVLPNAQSIAILIDPDFPNTEAQLNDASEAARSFGLELVVVKASTEAEIAAAFDAIARSQVRGALVSSDPFLSGHRKQIVDFAARYHVPAIYEWPEYAREGGLMSYGTNLTSAFRQLGTYCGLVLKGTKPSDLPVVQEAKVELVLNLKTAKALGINFPPTLLARADEVIE